MLRGKHTRRSVLRGIANRTHKPQERDAMARDETASGGSTA